MAIECWSSHWNSTFLSSRRLSGSVISDRWGINFARYVTIPWNLFNAVTFSGSGICNIGWIFSGSGISPRDSRKWPMKFTLGWCHFTLAWFSFKLHKRYFSRNAHLFLSRLWSVLSNQAIRKLSAITSTPSRSATNSSICNTKMVYWRGS